MLVVLLAVPLYTACSATWLKVSGQVRDTNWRTANRDSAGFAPDPASTREAVVQVYAARAVRWRGYFGVHTWIAVKRTDASEFTVYEVNGHRLRRQGTALVVGNRTPDGYWYGNRPDLLADRRGAGVEALIDRIEAAVAGYPWPDTYHIWPGPNSNTFTAHVLRAAPELRVDLPPTAVGKDFLGSRPVGRLPSGTGGQLSLFGTAGIAVGLKEGLEINILGATFGIDPASLSIKLPLIGRIGPDETPHPPAAAAGVSP